MRNDRTTGLPGREQRSPRPSHERPGSLIKRCPAAEPTGIKSVRRLNPAGGALFDPVGQLGDLVEQAASLPHELANLAVCMHDRGVVATAELLTNLR